MPGAPIGNKYAVGNKGGRPKNTNTEEYRSTVIRFRGRVVSEMEAILDGKDQAAKQALIMRMGPYCIPRDINVSDAEGNPIRMLVIEKLGELLHEGSKDSNQASS